MKIKKIVIKKLLAIVVLGSLLSGNAYSKVFTWTCLGTETKDFQKVYEINDVRKTVKHLTSYDFKTKKKYDVNQKLNIMRFDKDEIWSVHEMKNYMTFMYFDLNKNIILQTSIQPSQPEDWIYQNINFECFVSN